MKNILGFRSNKLWKKIIASVYYLFCLLMFLGLLLYPHSKTVLMYGTEQDIRVSTFTNFIVIVILILPIAISEIRYRCKLNLFKTIFVSLISFFLLCLIMLISPEHSEQYKQYLKSIQVEENEKNLASPNSKDCYAIKNVSSDTNNSLSGKSVDNEPITVNMESQNNKDDNKPISIEEIQNESETKDANVTKENPLLAMKFSVKDIYNGYETAIIGHCGCYEADFSILECNENEWLEFYNQQLCQIKENYDTEIYYVEIDFPDGTALKFSNPYWYGSYYRKEGRSFKTNLNNMLKIKFDGNTPIGFTLYIEKNGTNYFPNLTDIKYFEEDNIDEIDSIDDVDKYIKYIPD